MTRELTVAEKIRALVSEGIAGAAQEAREMLEDMGELDD